MASRLTLWQNKKTARKVGSAQLAITLQLIESSIFIDDILAQLLGMGVVVFSKHDSILCRESDLFFVKSFMEKRLNFYLGIAGYSLKVEHLRDARLTSNRIHNTADAIIDAHVKISRRVISEVGREINRPKIQRMLKDGVFDITSFSRGLPLILKHLNSAVWVRWEHLLNNWDEGVALAEKYEKEELEEQKLRAA